MRVFFSRRVIIALVSGLLTLAIVAGVALAFNLRSRQPGAQSATAAPTQTPAFTYSVTVTPTTSAPAPTHTPTTGKTTTTSTSATHTTNVSAPPPTHGGRAPTSAPVASDTPTPTPTTPPGGATPIPTLGGSPTMTPTATPTPAPTATPTNPVDGSTVMGPYTVSTAYGNGGWITVPVVMKNTGSTTWLDDWSYYLWCVSNCMNGYKQNTSTIAPGATEPLNATFYAPSAFTRSTVYTKWSMFHSGTPFGAIATIKVVVTVAVPLGVDPAPGCDSSTMSWSLAGGATCANGGLSLTTNGAQEPAATLQTGPASFNDANYYFTVDVTFSSTTNAWARLVSYFAYGSQSASSHCYGQGFDVQPDGTYRMFDIANCKETDYTWYTKSVPSGSTITITLQLSSGYFSVWINHGGLLNGGSLFTSGYPVVTVGGNNGAAVTVTNAELDTPVTPYNEWNVVS